MPTSSGAIVNAHHGFVGQKPPNATPEQRLKIVREHNDLFPRMLSHYCHKNGRRLHLAPDLTTALIYRL